LEMDESERLINEGNLAAREYDDVHARNEGIRKQVDALKEEKRATVQAEMDRGLEGQDVRASQGDARTQAGFAAAERVRGLNRLREGGNEVETNRFFRIQEIGRRLSQQEVRSSQIVGSAELNASVQRSISNDDPMRRMLEEARRSNLNLGQIRQMIAGFNQPIKAGNR
jgi:hypothetical protein